MHPAFFALLFVLVVSIPLWLRYQRHRRVSRRLAAQDDADTLSPRDQLAVALAYPHEVLIDGRVHATQGEFGVTGGPSRDRRIYIGDLWVRVHESLLESIAPYCTARVVRAWDKSLVVELNGVPVLPTLVAGDTPPENHKDHGVRLLGEYRESGADFRLRLSDSAVETGGLRVISASLIALGAVIVMLAVPSLHPVWFGVGSLPLVWGLLVYRPGSSVGRYEQGERLFRVRGRVSVADREADIPGSERIGELTGDESARISQMMINQAATGPVLSLARKWPVVLIGNIVFRYPEHWLETLRERTPAVADVTVTQRGQVISHAALSRYNELRHFPPVDWLSHALVAGLALAAIAIALFCGTATYRTPMDLAASASAMDWLDRLPAALAFYGLAGLGVYHGICAVVGLLRGRDRSARLARWLAAQ
ncbi:hypothetical protein C84B14_12653 [Salinisphaera sp. C84B14]|uniref:hypothetical protein n=1 Tax=Salinisphaera sp. C84B14 TaxID=1304155 RepID=UPI00334152BD